MPCIWSAKSGCIVASFIPLSKPLSITVTIMPSPSRPLQAGFRLVILVLSMTSSELIMVFATVFCKYDTGFSSNHSISSCKANHCTPSIPVIKVAKRPSLEMIWIFSCLAMSCGSSKPDNTTSIMWLLLVSASEPASIFLTLSTESSLTIPSTSN